MISSGSRPERRAFAEACKGSCEIALPDFMHGALEMGDIDLRQQRHPLDHGPK
jgi:hypothetical protein